MKGLRASIFAIVLLWSGVAKAEERIVTFTSEEVAETIQQTIPETIERYELSPEIYMFDFTSEEQLFQWEQFFKVSPFVHHIEKNVERTVTTVEEDEYLQNQWWIHDLELQRAWELAPFAQKRATVAVIDSGLAEHPDFDRSRIHPNSYDFVTRSSQLQDPHGHGTSVTGIIAAQTSNGVGVASTTGNFPIDVLALRIMDEKGRAKVSHIVEAIQHAIQTRVNVINLSLGGASPSTAERRAIQQATNAGILVITSGGNDALKGNPLNYPAAYPETIAVAATNNVRHRAPFSNYHPYVTFAAPGVQLLTTSSRTINQYDYVSGTSFATPIVSGTVAMMQAVAPSLSEQNIIALLQRTAVDLGEPGRDSSFGYGLIQPADAIEAAIFFERERQLPKRTEGNTKHDDEPIIVHWNESINRAEAEKAIIVRNEIGQVIPVHVTQQQSATVISPVTSWESKTLYLDIPEQKIGERTLQYAERYVFNIQNDNTQ